MVMLNPFPFLFMLLLLDLLLSAKTGLTEELTTTNGRYQLTYENVKISDHEDMGFLSGTILFKAGDWLSVGPSVSGAITGNRGGFITLGLDTSMRHPFNEQLELIGGILVGAGGGRGGLQLSGGGLMTRSYLALNLAINQANHLGLGYSILNFPNGAVHSSQPYFIYEHEFSSTLHPSWTALSQSRVSELDQFSTKEQDIALTFRRYLFSRSINTVSGGLQQDLSLIGIRWRHALNDRFFLSIGSEGAAGGQSSGYMQILGHGGFQHRLSRSSIIRISAGTGVAGGGGTNTGGGWLVDGRLGIQFLLSQHWYIETEGGYIEAPGAHFRATTISTLLGYQFLTPDPTRSGSINGKTSHFHPVSLRVRPGIQRYYRANSQWRKQFTHTSIDVLGLQFDDFIRRDIYLTGQSFAAYAGNAGAYMTGLVGLGWHHQFSTTHLFIEAEGLFGAAGGGGVNIADGFVYQGNLYLGHPIKKHVDLLAGGGKIAAVNGPFQAWVLNLNLAYRFSSFID